MAERRGFEPPDQFYPINRLAGGCLQPLGHLSTGRSGGGSRIRTHGAFALRFSRPAPSTTRPSLRKTAESSLGPGTLACPAPGLQPVPPSGHDAHTRLALLEGIKFSAKSAEHKVQTAEPGRGRFAPKVRLSRRAHAYRAAGVERNRRLDAGDRLRTALCAAGP